MLLHILACSLFTFLKPKKWKTVLEWYHITQSPACRADVMKQLIGLGIFTLRHGDDDIERPQWYLHRKTGSHIFKRRIFVNLMHKTFLRKSSNKPISNVRALWGVIDWEAPLKSFVHTRCTEKARVMVDVLTQNCGGAQTPPPIDMQKLFFAYTMDSISNIFFGRDTNTMCDVKDELGESFDSAHRFMMQFIYGYMGVKFAYTSSIATPHTRTYKCTAQGNWTPVRTYIDDVRYVLRVIKCLKI